MKKQIITLACMALIATGCGGGSISTAKTESTPAPTVASEPTIGDTLGITFSDTVRNDKTGNWRLAKYASTTPISDVAQQYYQEYFQSDDEIHAVVNFTLNTTSKVAVIGNEIVVDVFEYVDGEEHDAAELFTGEYLTQYAVSKE